MELRELNMDFSVCKLKDIDGVDFSRDFVFYSKTDDEISLVCDTGFVPENTISAEHGWKALKITGILDFGMVGVIAGISSILAQNNISLFVISTYNTDYILLKAGLYGEAKKLLAENGYTITKAV